MSFFRYPWHVLLGIVASGPEECPPGVGSRLLTAPGSPTQRFPHQRLILAKETKEILETPEFFPTVKRFPGMVGAQSLQPSHPTCRDQELLERRQQFVKNELQGIQRLESLFRQLSSHREGLLRRLAWHHIIEVDENLASGPMIRKPLIISIAEKTSQALTVILSQPKRVLRRQRGWQKLSHAREFDSRSIRQIAKLPGRNLFEKAGPKQRIPSILRIESSATLENRVVEHFCRLAQEEWKRTELELDPTQHQEWIQFGQNFAHQCNQARYMPEFKELTPLAEPCRVPNYTLTQNFRYRIIWDAYLQLLHRNEEFEDCITWSRRLFMNRAACWLASVWLTTHHPEKYTHPFEKWACLNTTHSFGLWLDPGSLPPPHAARNHPQTLHLLSTTDLDCLLPQDDPIRSLQCDFILLNATPTSLKIIPLYAITGGLSESVLIDALEDISRNYPKLYLLFKDFGVELSSIGALYPAEEFSHLQSHIEHLVSSRIFAQPIPRSTQRTQWLPSIRSLLQRYFYT